MSQVTRKNSGSDFSEKIFELFERLFCWVLVVFVRGVKQIDRRSDNFWLFLSIVVPTSFGLTFNWSLLHLRMLNEVLPPELQHLLILFASSLPLYGHFVLLICFLCAPVVFALGFLHWRKLVPFERAIEDVGIEGRNGKKPKVLELTQAENGSTVLLVASKTIGVSHYTSRQDDLESSFGKKIAEIRQAPDVSNVEIVFAGNPLPKLCRFSDVRTKLGKSYSFVVGQSTNGLITQSILSLPHLLVAGSTGGGKSVFMHNVLLGLLHSSPRIRLFILDLKAGVEAVPYEKLPNVKIARDESEAVQALKEVVGEMKKRLVWMRENNRSQFDLKSNDADVLVVSVDEASVLYGKMRGSGANKELADRARGLTDQISKLARACGIHLILATQKVSKETIDTRIQENIEGKLCYKTATIAGSSMVLGNKRAYELPKIRGRAIWRVGSEFHEVQTPFLSREDLVAEIDGLTAKYSNYNKEQGNNRANGQTTSEEKSDDVSLVADDPK